MADNRKTINSDLRHIEALVSNIRIELKPTTLLTHDVKECYFALQRVYRLHKDKQIADSRRGES